MTLDNGFGAECTCQAGTVLLVLLQTAEPYWENRQLNLSSCASGAYAASVHFVYIDVWFIRLFMYVVLQTSSWVVVKIMAQFLGTLDIRCRTIIGIQKGTIILTTTHLYMSRDCPKLFWRLTKPRLETLNPVGAIV